MPASKNVRRKKITVSVAISVDLGVITRLIGAIDGRESDAPLFRRWSFKRAGRLKWEKHTLVLLAAAYDVRSLWAAVVKSAKLPKGTVMYALRHTSIVRQLRENMPVRLVAALHDTSVEMIEKYYSVFITDLTEDIARRSALMIDSFQQWVTKRARSSVYQKIFFISHAEPDSVL